MTLLETAINLEEAVPEDAAAVEALWRKSLTISLGYEAQCPDAYSYFTRCISESSNNSRFWVARDQRRQIVGWQSLMPTRANPALRGLFVESSTYVDPEHASKGTGSALIAAASSYADHASLQYIIGYIAADNLKMRSIVKKAGWMEIGTIPSTIKSPASPSIVAVIYCAKDL